MRELSVKEACRDGIIIKAIEWHGVFGLDAKADFVAQCKIAKAAEEKSVSVDVIDGALSLRPVSFSFPTGAILSGCFGKALL